MEIFYNEHGTLKKHFGVVVYQIRRKLDVVQKKQNSSVIEIEGDLILRQGNFITDYDLKLPLEGVYIPKTGKLHTIIQPQTDNTHSKTTSPSRQTHDTHNKTQHTNGIHNRITLNFSENVMRQCRFRMDMIAGELNDTLVLLKTPVIITDDEVDWGQVQKTDGKEQVGRGVYMEGQFYSPNCYLLLLVNGRTFSLKETEKR
eukprot:TRINITY_DN5021_c0_g1_i12.p2 TRINITY_DN5021_c0_g1~~TRINITY_DN5021_c0_g1_i12.p2  ORF type:complete len:201 (-),score=18.35 TRINITY_DN5021_c0_g1_i12:709-1311(-)